MMKMEVLTAVTPLILVLAPLATAAIKKWLVDRPALTPIIAAVIGTSLSLGAMLSPWVMDLDISPAAKAMLALVVGMAGIGLREILKGIGVTEAVPEAFMKLGDSHPARGKGGR